jgi:23S rRNA pseudouridine1911/1915/1917 synthase
VLGDFVYGVASQWISRQALHAKDLSLIHPTTKEKLHFTSDLPDDMKELLKHIEV